MTAPSLRPSQSKLLLPKAPGFIAAGSLAEAELLLFTLKPLAAWHDINRSKNSGAEIPYEIPYDM